LRRERGGFLELRRPDLTCRANHLHIHIIARTEARAGKPVAGFLNPLPYSQKHDQTPLSGAHLHELSAARRLPMTATSD
jgi:hypothetical protein